MRDSAPALGNENRHPEKALTNKDGPGGANQVGHKPRSTSPLGSQDLEFTGQDGHNRNKSEFLSVKNKPNAGGGASGALRSNFSIELSDEQNTSGMHGNVSGLKSKVSDAGGKVGIEEGDALDSEIKKHNMHKPLHKLDLSHSKIENPPVVSFKRQLSDKSIDGMGSSALRSANGPYNKSRQGSQSRLGSAERKDPTLLSLSPSQMSARKIASQQAKDLPNYMKGKPRPNLNTKIVITSAMSKEEKQHARELMRTLEIERRMAVLKKMKTHDKLQVDDC